MGGWMAFAYGGGAVVLAFLAGWLGHRLRYTRLHGLARDLRAQFLADARREADDILKGARLEAKETALQVRQQSEAEAERLRADLARRQEVVDQRETGLIRKVEFLDQKESRLDRLDQELKDRQTEIAGKSLEINALQTKQRERLEEISGLSAEEALRRLTEELVDSARQHAAREVKKIQIETERTAKRQAQKILALAVQRYAAQHVAEESVSVVGLPGDEMKGRIIGREGRNIRAFEEATGVDVIIDDTPEAVILSAFDPVRREVAAQALQNLIKDGRIHPGRIEEVVERARLEMSERLREIGEQACLEAGITNLHDDMVPYIGRLNYRTSYGQNLLSHSKEVSAICGIIASELGLDPRLARRCGFLHDIGKSVDHEVDGPHGLIGGRICRKFGECETVVNAVEAHHADVEPDSPYAFLTAAADAASASRPGARRESLESYITRLENLEKIANNFPGVQKSYAIQAGREIRILVDNAKVSDDEAALLAEEISRRIEAELDYPGQIKIMVIRETRATAVAR
ncbi:MAG TPA: ribonuclease Y [Candidatus Krumholzibacteria bacterium]|nr:ribonuclease Y [Candidatus Krumholzibacteria bacterium]HPD71518.1 ribonuclease Y [Candidatus Krumholzibacteria bacterium]HRY41549.1 ribonuclease Y [Candidatus Krumholzibacteria bacterium]